MVNYLANTPLTKCHDDIDDDEDEDACHLNLKHYHHHHNHAHHHHFDHHVDDMGQQLVL